MDDNIDVKPSDPYMSTGHEMNQSDLLTYDMSNQQVPGYQDDDDYDGDEIDDGLSHIHNQSSFIPSQTGKEQYTDSSLSDSNVGLGREDGLLFDQSRDQCDFIDQGQTNPFQPDLLNMNPLSLESKNGHIRDDLFEPNVLSKMSSNQMEHNVDDPDLQTPDLLMMESSPMHAEISEKQEPKHSTDTEFKSCDEPEVQTQNELQNKQEAIENDFYNADDSMENYDDEYVDSEESEYSDYIDDEKEAGLEQIVPELGEEQHTEIKPENVLTDNVDPNIGASGFSQKEEKFSKIVQFDENVGHLQVSDEENGNIDDKNNQDFFSKIEPGTEVLVGSVASENATEIRTKYASEMASGTEGKPNDGSVEKTMDDTQLEAEPTEPEGIPKSNTFTIESDSSDLEERSLSPDPDQLNNMETGSQFQNFAAGHSKDQDQIEDLIAGPLMEEDEESDDLDEDEVLDFDKNETVSQQTYPFEGNQIPSSFTEQTSENLGSIEMEQKDVHSEIFNDNVAMASDQNQVLDDQDASQVELADDIQTETGSQAFNENVSDNMDKGEINFVQQPSSGFSNMISDKNENDNKILEEIYDDFDEFTKTGQIQSREDILIDTSDDKTDTGEMDNLQQHTSQMSSAPEIGGLIDIGHSDNQTNEEDTKTDMDTGVRLSLEPNISDISKTDSVQIDQPEMLGQGQMNSDSEEESYNKEMKAKESGMEGSIVLDEGETFDDQKFEQDIDESMSSEEDNETPVKGFVSNNLPQLSADEINQEKITPQSLDDTPIMTGLDTTSNDIQKDEESFDDQKFEQDIDEPMSSEEDNETPLKGFVSKNLPQLSADEINQEKITPQSLDDTPIMTGLDTTSNDIQKEEESFDDQKFEQDIDEPMSSEEDNETPVKGFVSKNLPQLSADEINQEKITPQSLDDTPIMTGLDTTSNDIQKEEESFDDQNGEPEIDQSRPSVDVTAEGQMEEPGTKSLLDQDEGEAMEDKHTDDKDQENVELSPEVIPEEIPSSQKRESGMEGSFVLDQGESFDDKHFNNDGEEYVQSSPDDSPEDEIPANKRESGMEGSFVLDEGETFDDKNFDNDNEEYVQSTPEVSPEDEIPPKQSRESGMEGSFVLDQGETFEDKQFNDNQEEFVQSTPEESPEDEIPANQMRESGMEGSFVLDEGETFDDKTFDDNKEEFVQSTPEVSPEDEIPANQMRESGMEGSFVLDEGETFDNNNFDDNGEEFVQSTPEVTPEVSPQDEVPPNQTRESGMEGSFVLDEGESFDDKKFGNNEEEFEQSTPEVSPENEVPPNQTRESGMEGSFVLDKGESFDDKKFGNNEEEFEQSTPEVSPEDEVPPNQTRESGMEGSFVLDEGESFDDKKFGNNEEEFEQSTPEVSPEDEVPASQMRESGIEGSFVLEEGETFDDKKFSGNDEEFVQSTPEISPEDKIPVNQVKESKIEEQVLDEMYEKDVAYLEESISSEGEIKETASGGPFVPEEEQIVDEGIGPDKPTIEQEIQLNGNNQTSEVAKDSELLASEEKFGEEKQEAVDEGQLETPGDSYGEEGDVDSAIQSPLSQDEMIQSPSSDVNAAMYVEHENEKNLMSSSLVEESFGLNQVETIETYQPCLQNGVSHSESEEVTPEKEAPEPICYQNGISQSASEEFTPEKEAKMMSFNLVQDDQEKESISKLPDQKLEVKDNEKVEVKKESKKIVSDIKKEVKETSKKAAISTKPERKKDITKETKKMSKDISQKKEVHSRLPSPTKRKAEKRSVSTSRITTPPSKTTTPATRMPRDTTRKSRPPPTSTEPTKTIPTKQRPKSIDISRTSSLTRPTASSLNKSRMFEKSTMEGTPSPTKPSRSITKTAPSRYRITKSKKDGSSDSGVEEDKSPRKTETQKKSEDEKVTRATSAPKKSTIPTMNRTPVKSEASPTKSAGKTTPTNRTAQSKIGSLGNSKYTPGGGQVKIQSQRAGDFSNVSSKIGSKDHMSYKPKGGDKKIQSQKLEWKAESKVGSLHNANHSPGGGTVKIATERLTWNAHSKVRSLENASHSPGGGHVKILDEKTYWTSKARVDALNTGYTPRHGDVQIQSENLKWKAGSRIDANNTGYSPGGGNVHIHDERTSWRASPKVKSLENADYKPGGGNVQIHDEKHMWTARSQINSLDNINYSPKSPRVFTIENKKLDFKDIRSKVGSKDKITYKPGGGDKKIETQKLSFKEKAQSKVGSKDNMDHKPAGGDKKIDTQKLTFKESAKPRTDTGVASAKSRPDSGIECEKTEASV